MRGWVFVLLIVILVSGCLGNLKKESKYVCPDGTTVSSPSLCPRRETTTTKSASSSQSSADFSFQSGSGSCGEGADLSFSLSGGALSLRGFLGTPTPCYTLSASHAITDGIILIEFYSTPSGGNCIQCLGQVPFEMKLAEIPSGSFGVKMFYDYNPLLTRNLVLVSDGGSVFFSCGAIAGLSCPEGMECVLDNPAMPDSAGRCRVTDKKPEAVAVAPSITSTTLVLETSTMLLTSSTTQAEPSTSSTTLPQATSTSTSLTKTSTSTVASTTSSRPTPSAVELSAVQFDAPGTESENLNGEWVEVSNTGGTAQDLSSWTLSDESKHVYVFLEGFVLGAGDSVKVHTGSGVDSTSDLYWNRGSSVWNNDGDTATLKDESGSVVDSRSE